MKHDNEKKLRPTGLTLDEIRAKVSGFHFGQECFTDGERNIMRLAESLLNYIDGESNDA